MNINKKRVILIFIFFAFFIAGLSFFYKKLEKSSVRNYFFKPELIVSTGAFSSTFEKEMLSLNISREDIYSIVKAYGKNIDFRKLNANSSYNIVFSSAGVFKNIDINISDSVYSVFKTSTAYVYKYKKIPIYITEEKAFGEINDNLWISMSGKGVPASIILDYTDVFSWNIDFLTEVRNNDKFEVFYEIKKTADGTILSSKIKAASYEGAETGKKLAIEFNGSYYDEKGNGAKSMFLRAPLNYRRISSHFTLRRFHPVLKYVRPHLGIDYAAAAGTPVSAVADGYVIFKGRKGGYGNFVEVKHTFGYVSSYGHLLKFSKNLRTGKKVSQGEIIAYVGSTGISTGPHLDFRIKQNGRFLNYLKIKNKATSNLQKSKLPEFLTLVDKYFPKI